MKLTLSFFFTLFLSVSCFAADDVDSESKSSKVDQLRCERFVRSNLKELKSKLEDNCNLDKPYSTSLAINLGEEHYMYCCHKKK